MRKIDWDCRVRKEKQNTHTHTNTNTICIYMYTQKKNKMPLVNWDGSLVIHKVSVYLR